MTRSVAPVELGDAGHDAESHRWPALGRKHPTGQNEGQPEIGDPNKPAMGFQEGQSAPVTGVSQWNRP